VGEIVQSRRPQAERATRKWPSAEAQLANVSLMLMSMLENDAAEQDEVRAMLRELVVPAFVNESASTAKASGRRVAKRAR
jgi:hypothetical protein